MYKFLTRSIHRLSLEGSFGKAAYQLMSWSVIYAYWLFQLSGVFQVMPPVGVSVSLNTEMQKFLPEKTVTPSPRPYPRMTAGSAQASAASVAWTKAEPDTRIARVLASASLKRAYQHVVSNKGGCSDISFASAVSRDTSPTKRIVPDANLSKDLSKNPLSGPHRSLESRSGASYAAG